MKLLLRYGMQLLPGDLPVFYGQPQKKTKKKNSLLLVAKIDGFCFTTNQ